MFKPSCKPNSQKTACLAIIQINILVNEQINITTAFYDEISKYSQSILANISSTKSEKCIPNFIAKNKDEKHLP
jgi:hypothetical protein